MNPDSPYGKQIKRLTDEITELRGQVALAREALEPFVEHDWEIVKMTWDDYDVLVSEAKAALTQLTQKPVAVVEVNVNISDTGKIDASDYAPLYGDENKGTLIVWGEE